MAQLTALQVFNKVCNNSGLETITDMTTISGGINQIVLNAIDDVLISIGTGDTWNPLLSAGTITLVTSTQTYAVPSDFNRPDKDSFIYNEQSKVYYMDLEEIDVIRSDQDKEGGPPAQIARLDTNFYIYPVPSSGYNGKTIKYRYWKLPSRIDTSSQSSATWFPEPFDQSVLVNLATVKVMSYMGLTEASFYSQLVFGVRGALPGSLEEFKKAHRSPSLKRAIVSFGAK